ncbi:MAG: efflux RND transporter periplasmic adaptor subunit [Armatimonadota bacterium]
MNRKRVRARSRLWVLLGVGIIIIALLVWKPWVSKEADVIIKTAKVRKGSVTATVSANGVLQPLTTVQLKSNVGGQVTSLLVDEGSIVKAGQLIAKIDPTDTQTAYDQSLADMAASVSKVDQARQQLSITGVQSDTGITAAREGLASAKAQLSQATDEAQIQPALTKASISKAQSAYASAVASYDQTKSALNPQAMVNAKSSYDQAVASAKTADLDLQRQQALYAKGFVAKNVVEAAEERNTVAQAQLDSAKRKLDTIQNETDLDLRTAASRVQQADEDLKSAKLNAVQDQIKQQQLKTARANVKQAEASLLNALAAVKQNKIRQGDIVQAKSGVKRSEAALKNSRIQLGYTTVVAPSSGVVTMKYVEVGSIVNAGRSSLAGSGAGVGIVDIADISRMFALVSVDETDIATIHIGQKVMVTIEAYSDQPITGKVTKIAPQSVSNQSVTTIPVTVELSKTDIRYKPGMNVTCDFVVAEANDVLTVPNEAIKEGRSGSTVTVMKDGKQVVRKVVTGLSGPDTTEIKSGLRRGDVVITSIIEMKSSQPAAGVQQPGAMGGPGGGGMGGGRGRGH